MRRQCDSASWRFVPSPRNRRRRVVRIPSEAIRVQGLPSELLSSFEEKHTQTHNRSSINLCSCTCTSTATDCSSRTYDRRSAVENISRTTQKLGEILHAYCASREGAYTKDNDDDDDGHSQCQRHALWYPSFDYCGRLYSRPAPSGLTSFGSDDVEVEDCPWKISHHNR